MLLFPLHTRRLNWRFWFPSRGQLQSGYRNGLWIHSLHIKLGSINVPSKPCQSYTRIAVTSSKNTGNFLT